jgi:tetratricopeptide (TPR) repeat protein
VLEIMAVLDKPVNPKLLQRFKRFSETPVLVLMRDLEAAGIVQKLFENGKLHFQIEQPKVREILYSNLEEAERRKYHGEVGAAFQDAYASREEEILEELAYHYQQSDRTEKALELALRAGERLKAIYANEKAYDYFVYVFEQIAGDAERFDLYLDTREKLGEICTAMGRYEEAEEHYRSLLEGCRDTLPPDRVNTLFLRRGKVFEIQGDYDSALKCYKDARNYLSTVDEEHQVVERPRVYNSIGWVYVCMGKYEKAMTISLEALRVIDGAPEQIEHAMIFSTIGSANYFKGNVREAVEYHQKSLKIKENLEQIPEITTCLNDLGSAYMAGAEYGEAAEHLRRALATSEEIGDPYGRAITLHNLARLYFRVGDLDRAEEYLEEAIRLGKSYNMRYLNLQNYSVRGELYAERGEFSKAEGNLFRVLSAFSKQGNRAGLCHVLLQIAALHRKRGNLEEARSMVEEARRYSEDLGIQSLQAQSLLEYARLLRAREDPSYPKIVETLREALALSLKSENPEFRGEINFELAEALVCKREVGEAKQYYKAAEERYREVLENLPAEFQATYEARLEERFQNWRRSDRIALPSASPAASPPPPDEDAPEAVTEAVIHPRTEDALARVNELMLALPGALSLADFLDRFLAEVMTVSQAEYAFLLSLSGRHLTMVAARDRDGSRPEQPGPLLHLAAIERAFSLQQPLFLRGEEAMEFESKNPSGVRFESLSVLPFLEPDGKKGAIYLINPAAISGQEESSVLYYQPFLNLLPLCYHHFKSAQLLEPELVEPELVEPELVEPELVEPELVEPE